MNNAPNRMLIFYQGNDIITIIDGNCHRAIFRNAKQPLAELSTDDTQAGGLLATDQMGSVLAVQGSENP
ncbi:hypothetical protein K4A76_01460 [Pseudomonas sp. NEEL19]|uniref:hypothetical protein n=1 Tax=Pseudomonas sp. NEEL19 TaxID=2867409 RepID=UPI0023684810|nr:hypothetical protein [Pseudomonas sp. NEEL19]WDM59659.1 hypothetical protein K4A76_01460 [Pseudomonas sp. NEEL19]